MSKTLMILTHPKIDESIGNRIISNVIAKQENTEVRHLDKLYPDFKINIKAEQEALLKADTIIIQYPIFWYSTPAILKQWIDQVIQFGFAFGDDNYNLEGKKLIASFTIGSPVKDYPQEIIDKIIFHLQGLAEYCKMEYVGEIFCNDINGYSDGAKENAIKAANNHAQKLLKLINSF
ncbi:MAG: NAD(P)H-dependent oxidoreductase [Flavobacteriales bacterium]|nr:NAD(P)H-dependent oxidoreductase [Flavobacteriales bacterium]